MRSRVHEIANCNVPAYNNAAVRHAGSVHVFITQDRKPLIKDPPHADQLLEQIDIGCKLEDDESIQDPDMLQVQRKLCLDCAYDQYCARHLEYWYPFMCSIATSVLRRAAARNHGSPLEVAQQFVAASKQETEETKGPGRGRGRGRGKGRGRGRTGVLELKYAESNIRVHAYTFPKLYAGPRKHLWPRRNPWNQLDLRSPRQPKKGSSLIMRMRTCRIQSLRPRQKRRGLRRFSSKATSNN